MKTLFESSCRNRKIMEYATGCPKNCHYRCWHRKCFVCLSPSSADSSTSIIEHHGIRDESRIVGRIRSIRLHNELGLFVESGVDSFSENDWCLDDAMQEVGLESVTRTTLHHSTGVWDGEHFPIQPESDRKNTNSPEWPSLKWLWRYGIAAQF